ncbi:MAG: AAA family ATPase, partial [Nanoarchaeota archaeon]|nr:AAA family ATPase [Nanoarchaeota archaeon]
MKIEDINPWWTTSTIKEEFLKLERRDLFNEVIKYIKDKQIITLTGLRRTGKTVLLHHVIDYLLKQFPKESILYYNFDLFNETIENILEYYKDKVKLDFKKEKIFVFLDEVQKRDNWENELKVLYDNFPNIKFFISGSSSLFIEKKTKESLAGRSFSFILKPLTFKEYLKMKKVKFDEKRLSLYKSEIEKHLDHYLKIGGFPELIGENDENKISRYVKESVIDKIVYIDIPKAFKIEEPELLSRILSIIS